MNKEKIDKKGYTYYDNGNPKSRIVYRPDGTTKTTNPRITRATAIKKHA